jgi:hypothetical protein
MVAITRRRVYALYPLLAEKNVWVERWSRWAGNHSFSGNPEEVAPWQPWPISRCTKACPARWRKARPGEGIGMLFWNAAEEEMGHMEGRMSHTLTCEVKDHGRGPCPEVLRVLDEGNLFEKIASFKWKMGRCYNSEAHL